MRVLLCNWHPQAFATLVEFGAAVVLVNDRLQPRPDAGLIESAERVYDIQSFDSVEELAGVVGDLRSSGVVVDRVASHSELTQTGAGFVADALGCDNFGIAAALRSRDKRVMKTLVAEAGVRTARYLSFGAVGTINRDHVGRELSWPVVVKTAAGMGTLATTRVDSPDAFDRAVSELRVPEIIRDRQIVVEQFVEGDELFVDALWRDASPWYLEIGRYLAPRVEAQADPRLNAGVYLSHVTEADLYERVLSVHRTINAALGITRGCTHLELFLDRDGNLWFSEIATRYGGGPVPGLLARRLGVHVAELWITELLDRKRFVQPSNSPPYIGNVHLVPDRAGTITRLPSLDELTAAVPEVIGVDHWRDVGRHVSDPTNPSGWCSFVFVGTESESRFEEVVRGIHDAFKIDVRPDP